MKIQSYRELEVWQCAIEFVDRIYDLTGCFPKEERYGLSNQLRRSAVSIPSNIAEGSARANTRELMQFINIARGSLAEAETQLIIAYRRKYIDEAEFHPLMESSASIGKMLMRLLQSLERKIA